MSVLQVTSLVRRVLQCSSLHTRTTRTLYDLFLCCRSHPSSSVCFNATVCTQERCKTLSVLRITLPPSSSVCCNATACTQERCNTLSVLQICVADYPPPSSVCCNATVCTQELQERCIIIHTYIFCLCCRSPPAKRSRYRCAVPKFPAGCEPMRGLASISKRWVVCGCVCMCVCVCVCVWCVCACACASISSCGFRVTFSISMPMRGLASINKRWVVWCCVCECVCVVCACVCQSHRVGFVCHLASVCSV